MFRFNLVSVIAVVPMSASVWSLLHFCDPRSRLRGSVTPICVLGPEGRVVIFEGPPARCFPRPTNVVQKQHEKSLLRDKNQFRHHRPRGWRISSATR
ncbi:hypothetical protein BGZ57DRAFT_577771 [Hyaloscypha finlandica]|nr:hypothetical protein BGZ57DRAFT_577771 [Hyaloscypha finlandica]